MTVLNVVIPDEVSYSITDHCALCRSRFSWCGDNPDGEPWQPWQSQFRALLYLDPDDKDSLWLTEVGDGLLSDEHAHFDVNLVGSSKKVKLRHGGFYHRPPLPTHCFHEWCYSALKWKIGPCTNYQLYKTIQRLEVSSVWQNIMEADESLWVEQNFRTQLTDMNSVPMELQPFFLSKLPAELRSYIWGYVGPMTAYSAFLLVAGEMSRLVGRPTPSFNREVIMRPGLNLSAKVTRIFGVDYIEELVAGRGSEGPVKSMEIVTGINGICGIKFAGHNWETNWLGNPLGTGVKWYGVIQGRTPGIRCEYNGLNLVNVTPTAKSSSKAFFWDRPDYPTSLSDPGAALYKYPRLAFLPHRLFFRYLPLVLGQEYARGLTFYYSYLASDGIVGLESCFEKSSQLSGRREGVALHFPFSKGEKIAYVWLCLEPAGNTPWDNPSITIQTTLGRIHTFGPYIWPTRAVEHSALKWILLNSTGCITGFYYENSEKRVMRLGIISDSTSRTPKRLLPKYHAHDAFHRLGTPNSNAFVSVAVLQDISKVNVCRINDHCTGLSIHYTNDTTVILGQWHSSSISEHSCIYFNKIDNIGSSPKRLYFVKSNNGRYVTSIFVLADEELNVSHGNATDLYRRKLAKLAISERYPEDMQYNYYGFSYLQRTPEERAKVVAPDVRVFSMGQQIAWWFSKVYENYDAILPWSWEVKDIPMYNEIHQDDA